MKKYFDTILDFISIRDRCLFCLAPLRAHLTNYIGFKQDGFPVINAPLESGRIAFSIRHTTESYDVEADAIMDIKDNKLVLTLPHGSKAPFLDQYVAKQALDDIRPFVELYCSKRCKYHYSMSSFFLNFAKEGSPSVAWEISPIKLLFESFQTPRLKVINDWFKEETGIHSLINENADPIIIPMIDFEKMGPEKLLTRVMTYAVYS